MRCTKRVMSPSDDGSARGIIDRQLAEMGLERRVAATFAHIIALPAVVADSDLIATLATSIARQFADPTKIRFLAAADSAGGS
ncbi:hypothetical protein AB6864_05655 [Serratia proteamaculans]|uniref:hypothetical protein n=1 Tax=Serratia proteamaculans TaxID=28151 RepID=UPI002177483B|nr:hypothetical protein [Serratia proteamaculans]CAI1808041.1 Uncharacterised protein [Serratia proteamaculans]CAI2414306.1 Uncharacterised protein [Serratia proteamaculans]